MSQIHVIAHTHWDQEWYFTRQDSTVLASWNFADVIDTLEQDPAYRCYHLGWADGGGGRLPGRESGIHAAPEEAGQRETAVCRAVVYPNRQLERSR
ncbi:alpha-mannosidase mngB [Enterobacter cancerogenus]|uniref:Alpha-mannosidase mngB n=1 Tax=Enterobacter cancerogenus TaxID=69218 RepID=A0A484XVJ5_9ENTR|nr:alpha-mannosidase mngB [Enterobacter cancerogenus]